MPTFTSTTLDRLLDSGEAKIVNRAGFYSKPPLSPNSKLRRRNSTSVTERKVSYTPDRTPLPDSSSFFLPSPYIVNNKPRGPRLSKSSSEVFFRKKTLEENEVSGKEKPIETKSVDLSKDKSVTFSIHEPNEEKHRNGLHNGPSNGEQENVHGSSSQDEHRNGVLECESGSTNGEVGSCLMSDGFSMDGAMPKVKLLKSNKCGGSEDFFDPNESTNVTSNGEGDDHTMTESTAKSVASGVEFYDAWDELSPDSAPQSVIRDVEAELHEIRSSLLMEIENRKQTEEALNKIQCNWQKISKELAILGLSLPANVIDAIEDQLVKPAEEVRQEECIARFVSLSVGRGIARAEMEKEMESQIESKNFEIARLLDRLHYYEAVNREMSQRNQEAIEMARRDRQRKKRRQRWVWGSIAAAITLGTTVLAWSYLPPGKGTSTSSSKPLDSDTTSLETLFNH